MVGPCDKIEFELSFGKFPCFLSFATFRWCHLLYHDGAATHYIALLFKDIKLREVTTSLTTIQSIVQLPAYSTQQVITFRSHDKRLNTQINSKQTEKKSFSIFLFLWAYSKSVLNFIHMSVQIGNIPARYQRVNVKGCVIPFKSKHNTRRVSYHSIHFMIVTLNSNTLCSFSANFHVHRDLRVFSSDGFQRESLLRISFQRW